jgi:hypothetical protein
MEIIIRHLDGRREEAVMLAVSVDRMRISSPGCEDTMELQFTQGTWTNENHEPLEIEALISGTDLSSLFAEIRPRACKAAAYGVI